MDKEERETWERLTEEEKVKRLLTRYELETEHYRRVRSWLIFVCVALAIACGIFVQKWQEEKTFRVVAQAFVDYYEQDSEHYRQLYYDCLEGKDSLPWEGYAK
jgi:hypothetical protein